MGLIKRNKKNSLKGLIIKDGGSTKMESFSEQAQRTSLKIEKRRCWGISLGKF